MPETVGLLLIAAVEFGGAEAAIGAGGWVTTTTAASGLGATLFGGITVATAISSAALLAGSAALAYATAPDVPKPSDGATPLRQPIPPRPFGYGRCRLAGSYMLFEVSPTTKDSWDVLALHHGTIGGIVLYYLNEDIITLSGAGVANGALNWTLSDGRYGANVPANAFLTIKTTLGPAANTAFADVISALPQFWTAAHRGDGIATLMMRTRTAANADAFPTWYPRGLPKPSVVADLSPIYDPRDGGQDREDATTWVVSSNPVLQLIDYLTQDRGGPLLDWDTLIEPVIDDLMGEADICDELVDKADGSTEVRYASNGWFYLTTEPAEVFSALMVSCDGWFCEAGDGTLALKVGKYRTPTITLTDDHILGFTLDKGVADEEVVNEIRFSYTAVGNNYREAAGDPWRDETSIAALGKTRSQTMSATWVQSHTQGRRLAKRAMARHQALARGSLKTTLYGLKLLGERWVAVQSDVIADLADAVVEIMPHPRVDLAHGTVTFQWVLVDPDTIDAWDETTEEGDAPNFFPVPGTAGATPSIVWSDNGAASHKIKVIFSDPSQNWLAYVMDYRLASSSGAWTRETFAAPQVPAAGSITLRSSAITPGTYSVRLAAVGGGTEALGNWTSVAGTSVVIA